MSLLVTASLLGSWEWYLNSWDDGEEQALADFVTSLNRESIPDNPAMKAGRDFEDAVTALCVEGKEPGEGEYGDCVREVASYVRDGCFQLRASKEVDIDGTSFLLYGRLDALRGAWIYDIKYGRSFEMGKYYKSPQTKMYLDLIDGPIGMRYLYSDGAGVYVDEYRREVVESVIPNVKAFWDWINNFPEYLAIYKDKWTSKY